MTSYYHRITDKEPKRPGSYVLVGARLYPVNTQPQRQRAARALAHGKQPYASAYRWTGASWMYELWTFDVERKRRRLQ